MLLYYLLYGSFKSQESLSQKKFDLPEGLCLYFSSTTYLFETIPKSYVNFDAVFANKYKNVLYGVTCVFAVVYNWYIVVIIFNINK